VYLLVANGFPPTAYGGVEVYVSDLARALSQEGCEVAVVCAERRSDVPDGGVIRDRFEDIPVFRIVNDFKNRISFSMTYLDAGIEACFAQLLGEVQPSVVHFNHVITLSAGLPKVVDQLGIPSVYTLHDFWPLCQRVNLLDWRDRRCPGPRQGGDCHRCLARGTVLQQLRTVMISAMRSLVPHRLRVILRDLLSRQGAAVPDLYPSPEVLEDRYEAFRSAVLTAQRVLAPSQFVKNTYVRNGYPEDKIEVLPLGLDRVRVPVQRGIMEKGQLRIGYVGSMLPIKGVDILIKAFRRVREPSVSLDLYGRLDIIPSYSRQLRLLALLDRRVRFRGSFRPEDKDRIYNQIDVLVVPSLAQETFSFVAREALIRGIPVLASSVGALSEVVEPGVNGWLVAPGNVSELANVLRDVVQRRGVTDGTALVAPDGVLSVHEHMARIASIYDAALASG